MAAARLARRSLQAVAIVTAVVAAAATRPPALAPAPADAPPTLPSAAVAAQGGSGSTSYEGVVEALRQTVVAAQVPGAVVALPVHAGDKVQAGQVLMRIDARAADQTAAAGAAQARAGRAALEASSREFARQQQLFAQGFISQAALDRAEAHFKTAQADASAQLANAGAARTQSDLYVVKAPYGGVVASVSVVLGDMALPGRPLLTLYAPDRAVGAEALERVAHSLEIDLKRVPGTREVTTLGGPGRAALVELDPQRMANAGVTVAELRQALLAADIGAPVGELLVGNRAVAVEAGPYLRDAKEVGELVVGARHGKPVEMQDVATVRELSLIHI